MTGFEVTVCWETRERNLNDHSPFSPFPFCWDSVFPGCRAISDMCHPVQHALCFLPFVFLSPFLFIKPSCCSAELSLVLTLFYGIKGYAIMRWTIKSIKIIRTVVISPLTNVKGKKIQLHFSTLRLNIEDISDLVIGHGEIKLELSWKFCWI